MANWRLGLYIKAVEGAPVRHLSICRTLLNHLASRRRNREAALPDTTGIRYWWLKQRNK